MGLLRATVVRSSGSQLGVILLPETFSYVVETSLWEVPTGINCAEAGMLNILVYIGQTPPLPTTKN